MRLKTRLLLFTLACVWLRSHGPLMAAPFPDDCANVCSSDPGNDCFQPCYASFSDFESDIKTDCDNYGVCGYEPTCGDSICENGDAPFYFEDSSSCPGDCYYGGCEPNWVLEESDPIGQSYDEDCAAIDSPEERESEPEAGGTDTWYCTCTAEVLSVDTYFDTSLCGPEYYKFSCSTEAEGEFEGYSDSRSGFCCANGDCSGATSCPY